jgi:hypothetical protein
MHMKAVAAVLFTPYNPPPPYYASKASLSLPIPASHAFPHARKHMHTSHMRKYTHAVEHTPMHTKIHTHPSPCSQHSLPSWRAAMGSRAAAAISPPPSPHASPPFPQHASPLPSGSPGGLGPPPSCTAGVRTHASTELTWRGRGAACRRGAGGGSPQAPGTVGPCRPSSLGEPCQRGERQSVQAVQAVCVITPSRGTLAQAVQGGTAVVWRGQEWGQEEQGVRMGGA